MSGYIGILRFDGEPLDRAVLTRAGAALACRGAGALTQWCEGTVGVAVHLSARADDIPAAGIASLSTGARIAGQVRLDDQATVRRRTPRTRAAVHDIDLLAALVDHQRGDDLPEPLLGDYSAVVVAQGALRAWRDPFGVRLLYHVRVGAHVAVSNTIAALLALPGITDRLDDDAVACFLDTGELADRTRTLYADVRRVPPAHVLVADRDGTVAVRRYWEVPTRVPSAIPPVDYPAAMRGLLEDAVRDRVRGRPVSILMSGGLDSTALAAVAQRTSASPAAAVSAVTAHYTTVVRSDETSFARLAAEALHVPLTEIDADALGYLERWERVTHRVMPGGEPDLSTSEALLSGAAARAPVVLMGYDGDTLLEPPSVVPLVRRYGVRLPLEILRFWRRAGRRPHLAIRDLFPTRTVACAPYAWLPATPRAMRTGGAADAADAAHAAGASAHPTRPEMVDGLTSTAWEHIFESSDPGFTGMSVEVCFPYLDRRLIELSLAAPPLPWMQHKLLLREAMLGLLPDAVRTRPKQGSAGYFAGRLAQLIERRGGSPHLPEAWAPEMSRHVNTVALPRLLPVDDIVQALALLRVRELNDWFLARRNRGATHPPAA